MHSDMVVLTVNRQKKLRLHQSEDQFLLLLCRVARDMNVRKILISNRCTCLDNIVHHFRDRSFVAGNRLRRDNDRIGRLELDMPMLIGCHSEKCCHIFTL